MDGEDRTVVFAGDLDDPWVDAIGESLHGPWRLVPIDCPGSLPERPWDEVLGSDVLILMRNRITPTDTDRFARWRSTAGTPGFPRAILGAGPYLRRDEVECWSALVDQVVPEVTALQILPGIVGRYLRLAHLEPASKSAGSALDVEIVSRHHELGAVLVEACARAGHRVRSSRELLDREGAGKGGNGRGRGPDVTLWDAPVLEPGWAELLSRRAREGPVVVLLGFADRVLVSEARDHGAMGWLELPCNLEDLRLVLDTLSRKLREYGSGRPVGRPQPAHPLPPPPARSTIRGRAPGRITALRSGPPEPRGLEWFRLRPTDWE